MTPGDRVGAVLGGRAVAQDLDRANDRAGQRVEFHGRGATTDGAINVHERRGVAALRVDEYERLIGSETAQRRRPDRVRAIR